MKINALFLSVSITTLLFLTGCGEDLQKNDLTQTDSKSMLNTDNYINLAKYYYLQESHNRHIIKSKSMKHLKNSRNNKDTFYIKSNKNLKGTITSMIIKNNNTLISITIDNQNAKVSLHGTNSNASKTLSLVEFSSFDIDESVENEGEVK